MRLIEALKTLQEVPADGPRFGNAALACGFTPLHLRSFLAAHLQRRSGRQRRVVVEIGLFGDALGNLERLATTDCQSTVAVMEWSDLDPRLGIRHLGGWRPRDLPDISATVRAQVARLESAVAAVAEQTEVVVCLPTLPLPPVSYHPGTQESAFETDLRAAVAELAARLVRITNLKLVNPQRLDRLSPPASRLDVKSELSSGFPYTMAHADAVADLLAQLILADPPKKGLITDLDDTLWKGIVGDVGLAGISWHLDQLSHRHGLYQQMLRSLAEAGVLVAVASKNDPSVVREALGHEDLVPLREHFFPLEISWGPKSEAIGRILRAWNIGAADVVFVDDSPMELAEVRAAYPGVECLAFPDDDAAVYDLIVRLRDLFGKGTLSAEDAIRVESLRRASLAPIDAASSGASFETFLERLEAEVSLEFVAGPPPARALELVNKTNQFNLNGRRFTEGEWLALLREPGTFLLLVGYRDKFGPLGTIAVVAGRTTPRGPWIESWVMSCRAFSRRIEHLCLQVIFERFGAETISFDYQPTPKNDPLRKFFKSLLGAEPASPLPLAREVVETNGPALHHKVTVT